MAASRAFDLCEASAGDKSGFALLYSAVLQYQQSVLGCPWMRYGVEHTCILTMDDSLSEKERCDRQVTAVAIATDYTAQYLLPVGREPCYPAASMDCYTAQ